MEQVKHTPGPWKVEMPMRKDRFTVYIGVSKNNNIFAELLAPSGRENKGKIAEQRANARLMAAAPELLEALRGALVDGVLQYHSQEWVAVARAVIAKAEGRSC